MKKTALYILLLQVGFGAMAQKMESIDSLKKAYWQTPANLETLEKVIEFYITENLDSLNYFTDKFLTEAANQNNKEMEITALLAKVNAHLIFNQQSQADSILSLITVNQKTSLSSSIQFVLTKGRVLKQKGNYDEALENFYEVIRLIKDNENKERLPETYAEIASVLRENNDLENCTKYYRYALSEAKKNKNIKLQVDVCYALCRVYNGGITVNLDSSVYYGKMGMNIAKNESFESGYAKMLYIVAAPIIRQGQYRQGLQMSKEALGYAGKYNFSNRKKYYLINNQGFAYEKLGLYDSAWIKMKEGAEILPKGFDTWRLKYLIQKSKKDYKNAMATLEVYQFKRDSTIKSRNDRKLSAIQARNEAELQEREVLKLRQKAVLQELEITQQRYITFGVGLFALLLFLGGFLLYRQRQMKQKQLLTQGELDEVNKRLAVEQQYREAELKALRSQMNPHFIFNALNSIQEYIMTNEKKLAGKYLGKFADLMRIYLEHSQSKSISLSEEIETITLYLELEKLRFEDSLEFTIKVAEGIDTHVITIPTLLIQPYVENALKHGLLHKKPDRKLRILFKCEEPNHVLTCEIVDNGVGRARAEEINKMRDSTHKSFATSATQSRLNLLNHTKEKKITVEIIDLFDEQKEPKGTKVIINIPI